jgi:uncharacterized membrane protein YdjX (TVP38/TMEM64 family)
VNVGPRTATGAVLAAVLVAGLFISHDYHVDVSQVAKVIAAVRAMGPLGWLSFASMQAVIAALGIVPASPLGIGAGLATGVWFGFLLSATGTLLGGLMAFQLSRSLLRPWISRFLVKRMGAARLDDAIARDGWKFVCLMRISPIMPFAVTSYALGLTQIRLRAYLLGTLASLPALLGYVMLGALANEGLAATLESATPLHWVLLAVGVVATGIMILRIGRMVAAAGVLPGLDRGSRNQRSARPRMATQD